jgi:uncharacterized membrane protein YdjX (TVP38/TMEM64 family)
MRRTTADPDPARSTGAGVWRLLALAALLAILLASTRLFNAEDVVAAALDWVESQGLLGYLALIFLYVIACVLFVPGSLLTFGAGAIYGFFEGFLLVSVGSTLGATAAFLIGRYFARDRVARWVTGSQKFRAIDDAVAKEGWKIVALTRMSPIFPFNLLNYAYGLTRIALPQYMLASWIGMMPGTAVVVYVGALAGNVATLDADQSRAATTKLIFQAVGLMATLAVTVYVTQISRRALKEQVGEATDDSPT